MKIFQALSDATEMLEKCGVANPRQDAEFLLSHVLGKNKSFLIAHSRDDMDPIRSESYFSIVQDRSMGKPLQYILGVQEFLGMEFEVTADVLIPRPETELLVEAARVLFSSISNPRIVDVGTGSGCIAISLAVLMVSARIWAVDLSEAALVVAKRNAARHRIRSRLEFLHGNLLELTLEELGEGTLDGVVSNPPYVSEKEFPGLQREVRGWEPRLALVGGERGLSIYEQLIPQAYRCLKPRGHLLMEIGYDMREKVLGLLSDGWDQIRVKDDSNQIPRVVIARKRQ